MTRPSDLDPAIGLAVAALVGAAMWAAILLIREILT